MMERFCGSRTPTFLVTSREMASNMSSSARPSLAKAQEVFERSCAVNLSAFFTTSSAMAFIIMAFSKPAVA